MKTYFVYMMASHGRTLYTGITHDLLSRVHQHKTKLNPSFTRRYNVVNLVYYEIFADPRSAIRREKQIKGWLRAKKLALIETTNPKWRDLSEGWFTSLEEAIARNRAKAMASAACLRVSAN